MASEEFTYLTDLLMDEARDHERTMVRLREATEKISSIESEIKRLSSICATGGRNNDFIAGQRDQAIRAIRKLEEWSRLWALAPEFPRGSLKLAIEEAVAVADKIEVPF